MRVKICGITQLQQAKVIAQLGATYLGFICVPASPRYLTPVQICEIAQTLQLQAHTSTVQRIGVFVDADIDTLCQTVAIAQLTGVQLHGNESVELCDRLRQRLPDIEIIKAFRLRSEETLATIDRYGEHVDAVLLDAFDPKQMGGTGKTLDWKTLQSFQSPCPWLLAGGLTPVNVMTALRQAQPDGIDLSSGVEYAPGQKDLRKVEQLFTILQMHKS